MVSWFNSLSNSTQIIAGLMLIVGISVLDFITGTELSFSIFYLIPIVLVSWYVNLRTGVAFSIISAVAWALADNIGGNFYSSQYIFFFNTLVRLAIFLIVANMISKLKESTVLINEKKLLAQRSFDVINTSQRLVGVMAKNVIAHNSNLLEWLAIQKQNGQKYPEIIESTCMQIGSNLATLTEMSFSYQPKDVDEDLENFIDQLEEKLDQINEEPADRNTSK